MQTEELYPELMDYIYDYFGRYFTEHEIIAHRHLTAMSKSGGDIDSSRYKFYMKSEDIYTNPIIVDLVKGGFAAFKIRVVNRIYSEHKHSLDLNLCTKCGKVARTPDARQCRFCYHDWH